MSKSMKSVQLISGAVSVVGAIVLAASLMTTDAEASANTDAQSADDPFAHTTSLFGNYLAGRMAGNEGDTEAAAKFFRRVLEEDPDNTLLLDQLLILEIANGNFDGLDDVANRLVQSDPSNRMARTFLALNALKQRKFSTVHRHMEEIERGTLALLTSTLIDAWAYLGEGDTEAALATVDSLQGAEWHKIFRDFMGGLIADAGGLTDEATVRLDEAYRAESNTLRIVEARARQAARAGDTDEALEIIDAFEKAIPDHPIISQLRADIEAGKRISSIVTSANEGAAEALYTVASVIGRDGGNDSAIVYLRLSQFVGGDRDLTLIALADRYEQGDRFGKAIDLYSRVADDSAIRAQANVQRAISLHLDERSDEAKVLLEEMIEADPTDIEAIRTLGGVYRSKEEWVKAAETYTLAIDQFDRDPQPSHWSYYYYRAIAYERSKQWPPAEKDLQQALELYPDHPSVLNYLGYTWADMGINLKEAFDMIERAVEQRPRDGYIVDSLGWAYYRKGDYDNAVKYLERAVELRPNDPVINDHLGDAYWQVGRRLEATFQWQHALDMEPAEDQVEIIQKKLIDGLPIEDGFTAQAGNDDSDG